jgi:hypothetical protein
MNICTFPFFPFNLQNKPITTLYFLTLNTVKIGMEVEVCNAALFHVHIE